jgi:hypothetical protein
LLVSTLAFQKSYQPPNNVPVTNADGSKVPDVVPNVKNEDQRHNLTNGFPAFNSNSNNLFGNNKEKVQDNSMIKVYYCSRTHSQLVQVIDEFRNCHEEYHPFATRPGFMSIIGSRQHLCINVKAKDAAKREGITLEEKCSEITKGQPVHIGAQPASSSSKGWYSSFFLC